VKYARLAALFVIAIGAGSATPAGATDVTFVCHTVDGSTPPEIDLNFDTSTNKVQFGPSGYSREDGHVRPAMVSDALVRWRYPDYVWYTLDRSTGVLDVSRPHSQYSCARAIIVSRF
jgi:hypothetical protein